MDVAKKIVVGMRAGARSLRATSVTVDDAEIPSKRDFPLPHSPEDEGDKLLKHKDKRSKANLKQSETKLRNQVVADDPAPCTGLLFRIQEVSQNQVVAGSVSQQVVSSRVSIDRLLLLA